MFMTASVHGGMPLIETGSNGEGFHLK